MNHSSQIIFQSETCLACIELLSMMTLFCSLYFHSYQKAASQTRIMPVYRWSSYHVRWRWGHKQVEWKKSNFPLKTALMKSQWCSEGVLLRATPTKIPTKTNAQSGIQFTQCTSQTLVTTDVMWQGAKLRSSPLNKYIQREKTSRAN